jgi:DNA-binding transcriptional ArsR family regulator
LSTPARQPPAGPSDVWAALADPTRRHLLDQLSRRGPLSATELAPDYPVSRQAVAKHLAALSDAGLVDAQRAGRDVRYRVVPGSLEGPVAWLARVGARWDRRLAALQSQLNGPPAGEDAPPAG